MELELGVPVLLGGKRIPQKEKLLKGDYFTVVTDKSARAGTLQDGDSASNLEIVTSAIDEHLPGAEKELRKQLAAIDSFITSIRQGTEGYRKTVALKDLAAANSMTIGGGYGNAEVNAATTSRTSKPEEALIHFTVGVNLAKFDEAAQWTIEGRNTATTQRVVRSGVAVPAKLARTEGYQDLTATEKDELAGFVRLTYLQARASAEGDDTSGLLKNKTELLSRTHIGYVANRLSKNVAEFVKANAFVKKKKKNQKDIFGIIEKLIGETPAKAGRGKFYAENWLKGSEARAYSPTKVFGEMTELDLERVGPLSNRQVGVPLELRHVGRMSQSAWEDKAWELFHASRRWHGSGEAAAEANIRLETAVLGEHETMVRQERAWEEAWMQYGIAASSTVATL